MAEGLIDWASLTEVANSYRDSMRSAYRWAVRSSIEVTCGLVHGRHLRVLPSPARHRLVTKGPHDVLRAAITEYIDSTQPSPAAVDRRVAEVSSWAEGNVETLRTLLAACLTEPQAVYGAGCGFDEWLSTALGANLEATGLRVGGLFDLNFAGPLASVLQVGEADLRRAWQQSKDANSLKHSDEIFDLVRSAHVLSIMLRGRYHDLVAQEMGMQVLHHPIRAPVLPELAEESAAPVRYEVTNTERVMAHLLWASGFAERGHSGRIELWAENVRLVRMAVLAETVDLPQRASADRAVDTAVDAARRAGVRTHSKLFEDSIDLAVAMGLGVLSSFVVNGWSDMAITAGAYAVSKKERIGERAARSVFESHRRLKHLAERPGRITSRFDEPRGTG